MEEKNSRRRKKNQEKSIVVDENRRLYNVASSGPYSELKKILDDWKNQTTQDEIDARVLNVYTELKLNNIVLAEDVELELYKFLLKKCFFSNDSFEVEKIKNHIKSLADKVDLLKYIEDEQELLIISLRFVVKEIHLLKFWLRSTYDVLPWEEIEFYLFSFIVSTTEEDDLNIFYKNTLRKSDLIKYLEDFVTVLEKVQVVEGNDIFKLPTLTRDEAVQKITGETPNFKALYKDIDYVRDMHSLHKICKFARLAKDTDPREPKGNQVIMRAIYVISQYLKYSLVSQRLSRIRRDFLILAVTGTTREIILNFCNTISPVESFEYRAKLIGSSNVPILQTIRQDIERIGQIAEDILFRQSIRLFEKALPQTEDKSNVLELIENTFAIIEYSDQHKFNDQTPFKSNTDKLIGILKKIAVAPIDDEQRFHLDKIVKTKLKPNQGELDLQGDMLMYICKPKDRIEFLNRFSLNLSRDEIFDLLDVVFSIQKDCGTKKLDRYEIARLNGEIINLLASEINSDDYIEKFNEFVHINRKLIFDRIENEMSSKDKLNYRDLMSERRGVLEKFLNKKDYKKVKDDVKSLETIKSLVLDIITMLDLGTNEEAKRNVSQDHLMLMEFLNTDFELIDLIFNSNMIIFQIATFIRDDPKLILNKSCDHKIAKTKTSFRDQFIHLYKKQKTISKLKEGDFEAFKTFIDSGGDIKARDAKKSTFLHLAVENSDGSQIDYLLNQGLDVYSRNIKNQTPLHIAAKKGNQQVVSHFINEKTDVHHVDNFGRTALHLAVLKKHPRIVEVLVEGGSDPFKEDLQVYTPALYASIDGNQQIMSLLINQDSTKGDILVLELFCNAIHYDLVETVDFILSKNLIDVDAEFAKLVMPFISYGRVDILEILLKHGATPNNWILIAVREQFDHIVEKLLEIKKDEVKAMNPKNRMTPLHYAAENGNCRIIDILFKYNADIGAVDVDFNTALHVAVQNGHLAAVKTLLHNPASSKIINNLNSKRYTALHIAADKGEFEIAKVLLENWAQLENEFSSVTPLSLAERNGHQNIVELLMKNETKNSKAPSSFHNTDKKLTENNKVDRIIVKRPGIIITEQILEGGSVVIKNVDDEDCHCSDEEIIKKIITQNNLEENIKHKLKILIRDQLDDTKWNIVMTLERTIFNSIISKGKLNIGWNSCPVSGFSHIYRCQECTGFGHNWRECENEPLCKRCSGRHSETECESEELNCVHCIEKNASLGLANDTKHSPLDQFCPYYRRLLKMKCEKQKAFPL